MRLSNDGKDACVNVHSLHPSQKIDTIQANPKPKAPDACILNPKPNSIISFKVHDNLILPPTTNHVISKLVVTSPKLGFRVLLSPLDC